MKPRIMDKILSDNVKASVLNRYFAKLIDLAITFFLFILFSFIWYPIAILIAICFVLAGDSINDGQSIGKKIIGLKVVHGSDLKSCTLTQSLVRNVPLGCLVLFSCLFFWGWILLLFIGLPLVLIEAYLVYILPSGIRIGDVIANTRVIEVIDEDHEME